MKKWVVLVLLASVATIAWPAQVDSQALNPIEDRYISYIIEDRLFTGGFHVRLSELEEFIEEQGEGCEGGLCLKDYKDEDDGRSVAEMVHDMSHELAINPYVILATLQKEAALITSPEPEEWQYQTAMGYGCPDDADCMEDFFGFANQIELGSKLLRTSYDRACGDKISNTAWWTHPRVSKGNTLEVDTVPTYIGNCATASLYNYTPHRVDSAWEPHDGQYYYGNYNFILLFHDWYPYTDPVEAV